MVRARPGTISQIAKIMEKRAVIFARVYPAAAACVTLIALAVVSHLAQNSQPVPNPSASASATASATPPVRAPSPTPLPAVKNFHQWGSVTVFNGLPSDSVRAIAQTQDGVMWFGTDNGLARFDGRRIQKFSFGSPDSDQILSMEAAPGGELFIGTHSGAFVRADDRFVPVNGSQKIGVTAILSGVETFIGTDSGFVMLLTRDPDGTYRAENAHPNPIRSDDGSPLGITSLLKVDEGVLAATSGRGVFLVSNGKVTEFHTSPRPIFVNSVAKNVDGEISLGTEATKGVSGVFTAVKDGHASRIAAPTDDVTALGSNKDGLWAGTDKNGLFHISGRKLKKNYTFENTSGGLRSDTIYTIFTDREGVLWIGTNRGVSRFDPLGPFQQTVSDIANSNFIRTLFRTAGGTIYAGSNRGLFVRRDDKWVPAGLYSDRPIYALAEDASGRLIAGASERIGQTTGDVRGYAKLRGIIYAAIDGAGLAQVDRGQYTIKYPEAAISAIGAVGDRLWIGTKGKGLLSFDGRDIKPEISSDILGIGITRRIVSGPDGAVWVAGEHGVFRITNGQLDRMIDAEDVRDVLVDGKDVWAATTTRGLVHARHTEQFGWLVTSIGFEQGLPSEKAFSILPLEDGLMVATNRGVVSYEPGSIEPKLVVTRLLSQRIHDLAELRSKIALDYPQNSLLVEVAGQSSRTFPEEFQYAFVLKNANGDVIESHVSGDSQFSPSGLKPGDYTIETTAFNRDLLASQPLVLHFSVAKAPFPWTATALGILLAIAVIALIWAIIERRRIVFRNRELAAARFDLAHEAERERSRIARDLHDQTLADLRDLMMKSDKTLPPGTGFREDIESISTEIRRICEDLSPSVLENVGLIASLEFLLGHTIDNYRFHADGVDDEQLKFPVNVQLQIYRIAQEVLTNIRRHADATVVEMDVALAEAGTFRLAIVNDGKPFMPAEHTPRGGRGIAGIRSRADLIRAAVIWDETEHGQPRFQLTLNTS